MSPESWMYHITGQGLLFSQGKNDFGEVVGKQSRVWTTNVQRVMCSSVFVPRSVIDAAICAIQYA
jgi:hypothetical protein